MKKRLPGQRDRSKFYGPMITFNDGSRGDLYDLPYEGFLKWLRFYEKQDRAWSCQIESIRNIVTEDNYIGVIDAFNLGLGFAKGVFEDDLQDLYENDRANAQRKPGTAAGVTKKKQEKKDNYDQVKSAVVSILKKPMAERLKYRSELTREVAAEIPHLVERTIEKHIKAMTEEDGDLIPKRFHPTINR